MPTIPKYTFGFSKGLNTEQGPFFPSNGYLRNGKNAVHDTTGVLKNRQGIEIVGSNLPRTISDRGDPTNLVLPGMFYAEITKNNGYIVQSIYIRWHKTLLIFANDLDPSGTLNTDISNINLGSPDFTFTLDEVSEEALYYKTNFTQENNAVIMTNPRSPIYKVVWGDSTGTETFTTHRVELAEFNEDLFDVPQAVSRDNSVPGWFSRRIPLITGTSAYTVLDWIVSSVPGYLLEVYKEDITGVITQLTLTTDYAYAEAYDTTTNVVTGTLTYVPTAATGEVLHIYFGKTAMSNFRSSLTKEEIVVSSRTQNYASDNSTAPNQSAAFAGRLWFGGADGPLDETNDATFPTLGFKPRKLWASEIFPKNILLGEVTKLICRPSRSPLDIDDNNIVLTDGSTYEIDDAAKILDIAPYGPNLFIVATNGVWSITGPEDFFAVNRVVVKKIIDHKFVSRQPIVSTEEGLFIAGENEIFFLNPANRENPIVRLVDTTIFSVYNKLTRESKKQSFLRYDEYNKRVYFFYPDSTTEAQNKYNSSGAGRKYLVFDTRTGGWFSEADITAGVWSIMDMVTVPANTYFTSSDVRFTDHKYVNLVLLGKKNGDWTQLQLGILEGKNLCSDYLGTSDAAPFESFGVAFNSFGEEFSIGEQKIVAQGKFFLLRTEQDDADASGFYEFPGAVYINKRINFATEITAGPLFGFTYNTGTDSWDENRRQIYFPNKLGSTVVGGGKPPFEVVVANMKVRGRGPCITFKIGNAFGDTTLTGTVQEQEKPWGIYGYQLNMQSYTLAGRS